VRQSAQPITLDFEREVTRSPVDWGRPLRREPNFQTFSLFSVVAAAPMRCPVVIRPGRKLVLPTMDGDNWRNQVPPPQHLLVKWRSHAGCGFNLSTVCLV